MAERVRRKPMWSSMSRFEQVALLSTILIWTGVVVFGIGLWIALRNYRAEQVAYAELPSLATTAFETAAPSPTPLVFPAGWSTATPTVPTMPTPTPLARGSGTLTIMRKITPTADFTPTRKLEIARPTPTKVSTPTPVPKPPDRVVIPAIKLDSPVVPIGWYDVQQDGYPSRAWQVADYAVSWHKTSAHPGSAGNMVLNGHHNIKGEVFRYLVDVEAEDRVLVYAGEQVYHYVVIEKHILKEKGEPPEVRRQNAKWIGPTEDERLTIITCWPYTNNTHRLVVVAKPVPPPQIEGLER